MEKQEQGLPLNEGMNNKVPEAIAPGAQYVRGLFSEQLGLVDNLLTARHLQASASDGPADSLPAIMLEAQGQLLLARRFPRIHSLVDQNGVETLAESAPFNDPGTNKMYQGAWPTQVIGKVELNAGVPTSDQLVVCSDGTGQFLHLVPNALGSRLVLCDALGQRLARDLEFGNLGGSITESLLGTDTSAVSSVSIKIPTKLFEVSGRFYVFFTAATLTYNTISRLWAATALVLNRYSQVTVVNGTLALPDSNTLVLPASGATIFHEVKVKGSAVYILWRSGALGNTAWTVQLLSNQLVPYAESSGSFDGVSTEVMPMTMVPHGSSVHLSWTDGPGGGGESTIRICRLTSTLTATTGNAILATTPGVLQPFTRADMGFYTNHSGRSSMVVFYQRRRNTTNVDALVIHTIPEGWTSSGGYVFERAHEPALSLPGFHLALEPMSLPAQETAEDACLFGLFRDVGDDPAVELMILRGDRGRALAPLARFGVDEAALLVVKHPSHPATRQAPHRGCIEGGLVICPYLKDFIQDAPDVPTAAAVTVELYDTGLGNWPLRAVKAAGKSYLAAGVPSVFDGRRLSEMAFSWRPVPSVKVGGADNFVTMYRWTDAAGDLHRSAVSSLLLASEIYVPVPVDSTILGNDAHNLIGAWVLNAAGGGFGLVSPVGVSPYESTNQQFVPPTIFAAVPYTDGINGEVQAWGPPALWDVISVGRRLVALDATNRRRILYTKEKQNGVEYEWAAELEVLLPGGAGDGVGLAEFDGNIVVVAENGVYAVGGDGYTNTMLGGSYTTPRLLNGEKTDRNARNTITRYADGVFWEAKSGYVALMTGWQVKALKAVRPVARRAAYHVAARREIWLCGGADSPEALVWNYGLDKWSYANASLDVLLESDGRLYSASSDPRVAVLGPDNDLAAAAGSPLTPPVVYSSRQFAPNGVSGQCSFADAVITGFAFSANDEALVTVDVFNDYSAVPTRSQNVALSTMTRHGDLTTFVIRLHGVARAVRLRITPSQGFRYVPVEARVMFAASGTAAKTAASPAV